MSPIRFRFILLFAAVASTVHCSGSDNLTLPAEGLPADIAIVSGNSQSGAVGQPLGDSLAVRLTDSKDRPVQGQQVQFTVVTGGSSALLLPAMATTNADGVARSTWVLGALAGAQQVQAKAVSSGSLKVSFTATATAESPDTIMDADGQGQTGIVGGTLIDSLVVQVNDEFGNPLPGQSVTWRVPLGEGTVSSETTTTGADGRTAVTRTLGLGAGAQSARASTAALPTQVVVFRHTAIAGIAVDLVKLSLDNQSGPAGSALPESLVVQAQDADGNGVPGQVITWVASSGGSAVPTLSVTDAEGKAFTFWTLAKAIGANTLTAAGFGSSIQYHATGVGSDPDTLRAISTTAFSSQAGQPVASDRRPSVRVSDTQGNPVAGLLVTFTVTQGGGSITDGSGDATTLSFATGADGIATLTGWTLGLTLGEQVVRATATRSGGEALSGSPVSFTATAQPGPAARLIFTVQPIDVRNGHEIKPSIRVAIVDANNLPVQQAGNPVSIVLGNNSLGLASLDGTLTRIPVDGVATFDDLVVSGLTALSELTLIASSTGLESATSDTFTVR